MKYSTLDTINDHIFDLAQREDGWNSLPDVIREFYPEARVALLKVKSSSINDLIFTTSGYEKSYIDSYLEHYHRLNPWAALHARKWKKASVYSTSDAMVSEIQNKLQKQEFYNDWIKPQDNIREGVAVVLDNLGGSNVLLTCMIPARLAEERLALLKSDLESIARPMSMAMQLKGLVEENEILRSEASILDNVLRTGVMVLSTDGRLLHANKYAQKFIDNRDGLRLRPDGQLELIDDKSRSIFSNILLTLAKQPQQWFVVERGPGLKPLSVKVLSIKNQTNGMFSASSSRAIVLFNDPSAETPAIPYDRISMLLGLTKSEAMVALALLECEGNTEIAAKLGLSRNTVRNQLAAVMAKTGVTRQATLVRLLTQLSMQIANE
jgi:DNA-binding CsgD family transcriptional regulator